MLTKIKQLANIESKLKAYQDDNYVIAPDVDICEGDEDFVIKADVPGVAKDDVNIDVDKNILTISCKVNSDNNVAPLYTEYKLYDYYRQFRLNEHIKIDEITAQLVDGVLTLTLPKDEQAKPKKIAISVE